MSKEEKKVSTKKSTTNKTNNKPKATNKTNTKKEIKVAKEKNVKIVEKIEENNSEKIKKIEEKAKKENKMPKSTKSKKENFITTIDEKRKIIAGFIFGLLVGLLIMKIFMPDRIATLKDGTQPLVTVDGENITADELYEDMKEQYPITVLLDKIDKNILNKLYEEDEEMTDTINSNAESALSQYSQYYGTKTEEETLQIMGFSTYDQLLDYFKLSYLRNKYLDEYAEKNIEDKDIEKYYDENVVGDMNCEHILVATSTSDEDGLSEEDAKSLAEEIINKINDGTSWEDIQKEYEDKITHEDLGYQSWNASLETSFLDALKDMDNESFSKEPIKTSYGYHVIYRKDQKETPKLKEVKETIIENLIEEQKSEDENLLYKALMNLREEHKLEFKDTEMKEKYEDYCDEYK